MRDRIICLVGPSGSGKTTIAKRLAEEGYNIIQSYTTRSPREPNEWGHIFVDESNWQTVPKHGTIAHNVYDGHFYWAVADQYRGKGDTIYVVDVPGVEMLRKRVEDAEIIVIYLQVEKGIRYHRMWDRYKFAESVDIIKRLEYDKQAFAIVPCDYVIDANGEIEEVVERVKKVIAWKSATTDQK